MTIDIKALNRLLDEIEPTFERAAENTSPAPVTKGVGDGLANPYGDAYGFMSAGDAIHFQRRLNGLDRGTQDAIFTKMLVAGTGKGTPIDLGFLAGELSRIQDPTVQKALDTTGGAALIRQDLDPMIVVQFIRDFPAWQRIQKVPANGVNKGPLPFAFA